MGTVFANLRGISHKGSGWHEHGISGRLQDVRTHRARARFRFRIRTSDKASPTRVRRARATVKTDGKMPMTKSAKYHDVHRATRPAPSAMGVIEQQDQGRVRIHDVFVRREVRRQERLPSSAIRSSTTKKMRWVEVSPLSPLILSPA